MLQEGNFFRDNLRTAKAEYIYIADGTDAVVEPYFTFYGFRYVKVSGWVGDLNLDDFTGCVIYSRMDTIGEIETSNEKVNQLFKNAMWGQKGNFLDIPTDCPQRDERLGWTGDIQIFSGTACFNMDVSAFLSKYAYDLGKEQSKTGGMVPHIVPMSNLKRGGSSAWGDVATIVPWNVYEFYGDIGILEQQFESMRAWVDYIQGIDEFIRRQTSVDGRRLTLAIGWRWMATIRLRARAARLKTSSLRHSIVIRRGWWRELPPCSARRSKPMPMDAYPQRSRRQFKRNTSPRPDGWRFLLRPATCWRCSWIWCRMRTASACKNDLIARLNKDKTHLRTGFVGTPYLCRVLSNIGANDLAYRLLLNEDYPSWLYAVNLGATTIWERWNSLNPDGSISSTGMNSLNHYAYGSIVEWMYRDMCGLNPSSGEDGVDRLPPCPDRA